MVIILSSKLDLWEIASAFFLCQKHPQRVVLYSWLSTGPILEQIGSQEKLYIVGHFDEDRLFPNAGEGITVDDLSTALAGAKLAQVSKIVLIACNAATAIIEGLKPMTFAAFPAILKDSLTLKCQRTIPVTAYKAEVNVAPGGSRFVWHEQNKSGQSNVEFEEPESQTRLQGFLDKLPSPANEEELRGIMDKLTLLPEWKTYCEEITRDFKQLVADGLVIPKEEKAERKQTY